MNLRNRLFCSLAALLLSGSLAGCLSDKLTEEKALAELKILYDGEQASCFNFGSQSNKSGDVVEGERWLGKSYDQSQIIMTKALRDLELISFSNLVERDDNLYLKDFALNKEKIIEMEAQKKIKVTQSQSSVNSTIFCTGDLKVKSLVEIKDEKSPDTGEEIGKRVRFNYVVEDSLNVLGGIKNDEVKEEIKKSMVERIQTELTGSVLMTKDEGTKVWSVTGDRQKESK